jgi:lipopolysaccharide/colanic/teichoic acid biosynthesis glycosyltransferase
MCKRLFDIVFTLLLLPIALPLIVILWLGAAWDTKSNGLFIQTRIGRYAKTFKLIKLRTMHSNSQSISPYGKLLRRSKLDELPQLLHVLTGTMSIVGPRPDIPGYYDMLKGEDRVVLELKPGLTSTAALKYAQEESLLAQQSNPLHYNDTVIFPDKVKLNKAYYYNRSFCGDIKIVLQTLRTLLIEN